jgi:TrmH family RNA methyltransferase
VCRKYGVSVRATCGVAARACGGRALAAQNADAGASETPLLRHCGARVPNADSAAMSERALDNIVVVLHRTQDLVNIAGTVRAMMNMGLSRLRLVAPDSYDAYRIAGIAHGSEWLLERVEFFDDLPAALADAVHVVGTTARRRTAAYNWQHPREAAPLLIERAADGPVAIVFGREDKGLSNEDLDRCNELLVIPSSEKHWSLNLAQAVLLIAYELRLAALADTPPLPRPKRDSAPARPTELEACFDDISIALGLIEFYKKRDPEAIMRTVRAVLRRADLTSREAKLIRAMAIEVRKYGERMG